MRTIRGESIGPFFESGRLRGTPEDDGYQEPEDDRRRCGLCAQWFAADELATVDGEGCFLLWRKRHPLICSTCEELIEAAASEKKEA